MAEHVDQEKLWNDFKALAEKNGRDASWTSEHWNDLIKFHMRYQPASVDRPLIEPEA
jgi:hypothetical protein